MPRPAASIDTRNAAAAVATYCGLSPDDVMARA